MWGFDDVTGEKSQALIRMTSDPFRMKNRGTVKKPIFSGGHDRDSFGCKILNQHVAST